MCGVCVCMCEGCVCGGGGESGREGDGKRLSKSQSLDSIPEQQMKYKCVS